MMTSIPLSKRVLTLRSRLQPLCRRILVRRPMALVRRRTANRHRLERLLRLLRARRCLRRYLRPSLRPSLRRMHLLYLLYLYPLNPMGRDRHLLICRRFGIAKGTPEQRSRVMGGGRSRVMGGGRRQRRRLQRRRLPRRRGQRRRGQRRRGQREDGVRVPAQHPGLRSPESPESPGNRGNPELITPPLPKALPAPAAAAGRRDRLLIASRTRRQSRRRMPSGMCPSKRSRLTISWTQTRRR